MRRVECALGLVLALPLMISLVLPAGWVTFFWIPGIKKTWTELWQWILKLLEKGRQAHAAEVDLAGQGN